MTDLGAVETLLAAAGDLVVAVSGGVDSLTLSCLAHRRLGKPVEMIHAVSPAVPKEATERVETLARREGWRLRVVDAGEFADLNYRRNPVDRCFYCKTNLFTAIRRHSVAQILTGANTDDLGEYRPGLRAAAEHGVRHPYIELGFSKADVRRLARDLGLGSVADLPAGPCLASRVETGIAIEPDNLVAIHAAEALIAKHTTAATVRCRLRASRIVVELDNCALTALDVTARNFLSTAITNLFGDTRRPVTFAPYRAGSAFLAGRA
jgi:uncharacterized protein